MTKRRGNSEGSIGIRKDGTYYGAILIDGKRHWAYGDTRKEVADKIKAIQQKAEQGMSLDAARITLGEFLDRWLQEVVKHRNKPLSCPPRSSQVEMRESCSFFCA